MMRYLLALPLVALAACDRAPPAADNVMPPANAAQAVAVPAPAASPADLSRYVGRYPFDRVGTTRFVDEPAVRRAAANLAPDRDVSRNVLEGDGPATPIVEMDGQILSWGCEAHNCGAHNWALLIAPDGSRPRLCHKPDGEPPRWYGDSPVGAGKDSCPSGNDEAL